MSREKGFSLISVIIIIFVTSLVSAVTAGVIITKKAPSSINYNDLAKDENLNAFLEVYASIVSDYYKDIDTKEMLESAVDAMLNYLGDDYTTYMNKEETKELTEKLKGSYKGIGVTIQNQTIIEVAKNSPAEKAGLMVGDMFIEVDGQDVREASGEKIASLIKDSDKKSVKIKVLREEKELEFNLALDTLIIPALQSHMIENTDIGYIYISIFSSNVGEQFKNAYNELKEQGMNKLIIDVRNNTGGYLDGAEVIASQFVEEGKLLYSLENKDQKQDFYDQTSEKSDIPVVILINGNTASASEILAAALKDSYGATLVGMTSFGKGKVQQTYTLEDGSMAKYTTAKWLRPKGSCIDGVGLVPDIEIDVTYTTTEEGDKILVDSQLDKAIEVLSVK